jgi:excisionase family DNA binding protein
MNTVEGLLAEAWAEARTRVADELVAEAEERLSVAARGAMTVKQAAEWMQVSEDTIRRWVRSGRLPAFVEEEPGRTVRISPRALEAMLQLGKEEV